MLRVLFPQVFRASPSFDFHTGSHRNIYFLLFVNVGLKILRYYLPLMIKLRIENTESRSLELTFPEKIDPGLRIQTCTWFGQFGVETSCNMFYNLHFRWPTAHILKARQLT